MSTEQAKIAEDAGAVAVMALEHVLANMQAQGGVARMSVASIAARVRREKGSDLWVAPAKRGGWRKK